MGGALRAIPCGDGRPPLLLRADATTPWAAPFGPSPAGTVALRSCCGLKTADWILDLGPEGGEEGGQLLVEGTPEQVAKAKGSVTGQYLKPYLK